MCHLTGLENVSVNFNSLICGDSASQLKSYLQFKLIAKYLTLIYMQNPWLSNKLRPVPIILENTIPHLAAHFVFRGWDDILECILSENQILLEKVSWW